MSISACRVDAIFLRRILVPALAAAIIAVLFAEQVVAAAPQVFTNSFLVEFDRDVEHAEADKIARDYGFRNAGPVSCWLNCVPNAEINSPAITQMHTEANIA